jgi:uncharacterized protein YdaU (DUF1376 family)
MSKAWMPLYIGDYLGDTSHLSQAHHGAYFLLMMHYWQKGMLQASLKHCYAVARAHAPEEQEAVDDVLREFFTLDTESYHHARIDRELSRITKVSAGNKERAAKAANARWNAPSNAPSIPQAMLGDAYSQSDSQSQSQSKVKNKTIKIPKIVFAENVLMTQEEHDALVAEYGVGFAAACIAKLSNYKGSTGKKYKNDYRAILTWVVEAVTKTFPNARETQNGKPGHTIKREDFSDDLTQEFFSHGTGRV